MNICEIADELSKRLTTLFLPGADGKRPAMATHPKQLNDPHFRDHILFYEYFHGDSGRGVGANHQTGWTGLIAALLAPADRFMNACTLELAADTTPSPTLPVPSNT